MVYDIDIHQLNLGKFKNLKFLDEIPFKKCVLLHLFNNEYNNILFSKKNYYHIKEEEIYKWSLHYFFNFLLFGNVS
jgi:hypothetical protein